MKYLDKPNLILLLMDDIHKTVVREDDTILTLILNNGLRFVKYINPTSGNLLANADTRTGKDYIIKTVYKYVTPKARYLHRIRISPTTFTYWHVNEENWSWNYKQLHLEDVTNNILNCEVMKTMSSGDENINIATIVINQKAVDLEIYGRPLITCSIYNLDVSDEVMNRFAIIDMDESEGQTAAIKRYQAKVRKGEVNKTINYELQKEYFSLSNKPVDVVIPFADKLHNLLPNITPMRSIMNRLYDYIASSAAIHQYQREKDSKGGVIATYDDYFLGRIAFMKTHSSSQGIPLSRRDKEVIEFVKVTPRTKKEIVDNTSATSYYCYDAMGGLQSLVKNRLLETREAHHEPSRKLVPWFYYKKASRMFLPIFPKGIEVKSETLAELVRSHRSTNRSTKCIDITTYNTTTTTTGSMVFCSMLNKSLEYTMQDNVHDINIDVSHRNTGQPTVSTPYDRLFGRYFGSLVRQPQLFDENDEISI